jgi:hypothetical protein
MKLHRQLIALAAAAALSPAALAASQSISFSEGLAHFDDLNLKSGRFADVITFTGLDEGTYSYTLDFSSQYINWFFVGLNDVEVPLFNPTSKTTAGGLEGSFTVTASAPFQLVLAGAAGNPNFRSYSGNLSVALVPEPETYAMLLAGLAGIGFILRRRGR